MICVAFPLTSPPLTSPLRVLCQDYRRQFERLIIEPGRVTQHPRNNLFLVVVTPRCIGTRLPPCWMEQSRAWMSINAQGGAYFDAPPRLRMYPLQTPGAAMPSGSSIPDRSAGGRKCPVETSRSAVARSRAGTFGTACAGADRLRQPRPERTVIRFRVVQRFSQRIAPHLAATTSATLSASRPSTVGARCLFFPSRDQIGRDSELRSPYSRLKLYWS